MSLTHHSSCDSFQTVKRKSQCGWGQRPIRNTTIGRKAEATITSLFSKNRASIFKKNKHLYFHPVYPSRVINNRSHFLLGRMMYWNKHGVWGQRACVPSQFLPFYLDTTGRNSHFKAFFPYLENGNQHLLRKISSLTFLSQFIEKVSPWTSSTLKSPFVDDGIGGGQVYL